MRLGSVCVGAPRLKWVIHAHVNVGVGLNVYVLVCMTCTALVASIDVVGSLVVRGAAPGLVHGRPKNRPHHCVPPTRPRMPNFAASELGEPSTSEARSKRIRGALGTLSAVPGQNLPEVVSTWHAESRLTGCEEEVQFSSVACYVPKNSYPPCLFWLIYSWSSLHTMVPGDAQAHRHRGQC